MAVTRRQHSSYGASHRMAVVYMLLGVVLFSFAPLVIVGSGGSNSPFLFNGALRLGIATGCLLMLYWLYRPLLTNRGYLSIIKQHSNSPVMLVMVLGSFSYTLLTWSTQYIAVPVATVLFHLWPVGDILLLTIWDRRTDEKQYRRNLTSILIFLLIAFLGVGFVVASETDLADILTSLFLFELTDLFAGTVLALLAAAVASFLVLSISWGRSLAEKMGNSAGPNDIETSKSGTNRDIRLFGAVISFAMVSFVAALLNSAIGVSFSEQPNPSMLASGFVYGFLLFAPAVALYRMALLATDNLGVAALGYANPIFALVWTWVVSVLGLPLWLVVTYQADVPTWLDTLSRIGVSNVPYLVIGTAAIISANLLINFEAERLLGFKVLVIALWVCGTVVYLRDSAGWGWAAESDGYFDVLFLSATVFALILSFRTQRLASRTQEEDNRAFKVFRELEELARWGVISPAAYQHIPVIDEKQGRDLETAYATARRRIAAALRTAKGPNREKLIAVSVDLDALAHSRQQGINFGEICALFIFAGLVVGTALLSRPGGVSGLTGFLVEMFAMLFPAVILFLAFNVLDLQRDRVSRILKHNPQYGGYGVAFQDTESQNGTTRHTSRRTVEQWISIAVGLSLIVAYAGLFLHKWEVWPQIVAWFTGLLS